MVVADVMNTLSAAVQNIFCADPGVWIHFLPNHRERRIFLTEPHTSTELAMRKLREAILSGELLPGKLGEYRQMNVDFHTTVMQLSGNPWIISFVQSLHNVPAASDRVIMWRDFRVIERSHDDHRRIAHALALGQGERASAIMREHITFALEHLHLQLQLYPQDFLRVPVFDKPAKGRPGGRNKRTTA